MIFSIVGCCTSHSMWRWPERLHGTSCPLAQHPLGQTNAIVVQGWWQLTAAISCLQGRLSPKGVTATRSDRNDPNPIHAASLLLNLCSELYNASNPPAPHQLAAASHSAHATDIVAKTCASAFFAIPHVRTARRTLRSFLRPLSVSNGPSLDCSFWQSPTHSDWPVSCSCERPRRPT